MRGGKGKVPLNPTFEAAISSRQLIYGVHRTLILVFFGKGKAGGRGVAALINPLSPSIKFQILLLCFHKFLTEVVGRSC